MSKKLAVIMTVYNETLSHLESAIQSTLDSLSNVAGSKLIIYVDRENHLIHNAVLDYLNKINETVNEVDVVFSNKNIGLANSLNFAINEFCLDYEFVGRMDADDICMNNRFPVQINYIVNHNLDIVGCNGLKIDEEGRGIGIIINNENPDFRFGNCMIHPSLIFRSNIFKVIGGYRNYSAAQDYDFLCRAKSLGLNIRNIQQELIQYRIRDGAIGQTRKKLQVMYKVKISKSYRKGLILSDELTIKSDHYKFYDFIEANLKYNPLIYRFATLFSILHLNNYFLNLSKRFL